MSDDTPTPDPITPASDAPPVEPALAPLEQDDTPPAPPGASEQGERPPLAEVAAERYKRAQERMDAHADTPRED